MRYIRLILGGVLLGAGLYFTPFFVFRFFLFGLLAFAVIRLLIGPRWGWGRHGFGGPWGHRMSYAGGPGQGYGPLGFADKVRNMTEAEYKAFQERFNSGYGYGCGGGRWGRHQAQNVAQSPAPEAPAPNSTNSESNA